MNRTLSEAILYICKPYKTNKAIDKHSKMNDFALCEMNTNMTNVGKRVKDQEKCITSLANTVLETHDSIQVEIKSMMGNLDKLVKVFLALENTHGKLYIIL